MRPELRTARPQKGEPLAGLFLSFCRISSRVVRSLNAGFFFSSSFGCILGFFRSSASSFFAVKTLLRALLGRFARLTFFQVLALGLVLGTRSFEEARNTVGRLCAVT